MFHGNVLDYLPLTISIASKFRNSLSSRYDMDDAIAEAQLQLLESAKDYDETRNMTFGSYAKMRIWQRLIQMYRIEMRMPDFSNIDIEPNLYSKDEFDILEERISTIAFFRSFFESLNSQEKIIVRKRLQGLNQVEIGVYLGLSQPTLSRRMKDIFKKFNQVKETLQWQVV